MLIKDFYGDINFPIKLQCHSSLLHCFDREPNFMNAGEENQRYYSNAMEKFKYVASTYHYVYPPLEITSRRMKSCGRKSKKLF